MMRITMATVLVAVTTFPTHAAIPADKANRIRSEAKLVSLQTANKASIDEALNALGSPDYVVEAKNYRNIAALKLAEGSAITLVWAHDSCVLSLLSFDKNRRAVGAVAPGVTYSADKSWLDCPDISFESDTRELSSFSCKKASPHKYCRVAKRDGVRDTGIDREAMKASPEHRARVKAQFSTWDGSHKNREKLVKARMHDPKSYEHVETHYLDRGDHLLVTSKFRGRNAFGALVLNMVQAKVDINGKILEMTGL